MTWICELNALKKIDSQNDTERGDEQVADDPWIGSVTIWDLDRFQSAEHFAVLHCGMGGDGRTQQYESYSGPE